ncbi:transglycosylase SLT domain-containing protein [Caldanaerobius polysaccharolyticus]|uniref:transglycosylase SLT domain-containing protein n=1 Tax=Caldanaerobius polysaccharolyticus TaxID=44256 RepID=UPI001C54D850|nr:transglycosylase SLT domain-containing protein [Caldanaerobius polysaccharolyticus]
MWGLRQLSRPYYALTSGYGELRKAARELGVDRPGALNKPSGELKRKSHEMVTRALRAAAQGFLHPEEAEKKYPHVISAEEMPKRLPGWLRKTAEFALDIGVGSALDLSNLVKVARVANTAEKILPWLRRLPEGKRALAAEEYARRAEQGITRLHETLRRAKSEQRLAEETVKGLRKQAKTAERFINKEYPELIERLRERWAQAAVEARRLSPQGRIAALEKIRSISTELPAIERRREASERILEQLRQAQQNVARAKRVQQAVQSGMQRLASNLEALRTGGEYRLFVGPVSIPIERIGKGIGSAYRYVVSHTPGVREVTNVLARAFRPGTVAYKPGITAREAESVGRAKRMTLDWLRRAGSEASATGRRALEESTKYKIPSKAWQAGEAVEALLQGREEQDAILQKLPSEIRPFVEKVADIWKTSEQGVRQALEEAFGPEMSSYFRRDLQDVTEGWKFFLEGYLPHIVTDPPEKIKQVVPKLAEVLARSSPGAKPGFTRERLVETIGQLKKAGLHPVEDVRILDAAHRAQAERLIQLKHMTDWLQARNLIVPMREAPADWADIGKVFPWLKGYAAHPEIADAVKQVQKIFAYDNDAVNALAKASQAVMNVFRPLVTTLRPKFHVYNTMGNVALAMQAGMKPDEIPGYLAKGIKVLLSPKTKEEKQLVDLFQRYGLEGQGVFHNVIEAPAQFVKELERYLERIGSPIGKIKSVIFPRYGSKVPGLELMNWIGQTTDSAFRMGAFLNFIDRGYTPWEAAQMVKRYFFDYSALSSFERNVMRHIFPFYAWMRYAIPRAVLGPLENPIFTTTFARTQQWFEQENNIDVDRGQLPYWLQTALIVGQDKDGKIIYVPTQIPQQTLLQFAGALSEKGVQGLQREIASNLSPIITTLIQLGTGVSPTGEPAAKTGTELLTNIAKRFVPAWEVEGILRAPYDEDRPRTTYPLADSLKGLVSPVSVYDLPYAQAREQVQAESAVNELISELRKTGVEVPETQTVESEIKKLDRAAMAQQVIKELQSNQWKRRLLEFLAKGSSKKVWDLVNEHPDLFYGSNEDVKQRIRKVITPENLIRLRIYLGRPLRPADLIEHYTQLERGDLPAVPPQARTLQKILEQIKTMKQAQASGGTAAITPSSAASVNRRFNRRLTSDEINTVIQNAIKIAGVSSDWAPYLRWLAQVESQFNPNAINADSGAAGLMQTKPSTFREYAAPGMNDIYNPLHNMVAAIRYIKARYGDPSRIPGIGQTPWRGY